MIEYLLESSICLISLYLLYWLVLSREKLLSLNRAYLLFSVVISLVFPLITVTMPVEAPVVIQALHNSSLLSETIPSNTNSVGRGLDLLSVGYWIGLSYTLLIFLMKIRNIRLLIRSGSKEKSGRITLVNTDSQQTFSFFHYVFINKELREGQLAESIIEHERAHARGLHSLDIILIELVKTIFWFNPVIYAYLKSIKLQHEYIADAQVAQLEGDAYENTLIKHALVIQGIPLSSAYAQPPIHKRLKMINENKTKPMKKLKLIIAFPLLAVLFITISCTENNEASLTLDEPMAHSQNGTKLLKQIKGIVQASETRKGMENVTVESIPSGAKTTTNEYGEYMLELPEMDSLIKYSVDDFEGYVNLGRKTYTDVNVSVRGKKNK